MRQKIPYVLMAEMRIRPELPNYNEIVHKVFLELIDGKLQTPEEMKAFLEPYSPPAPPPQVTIKRTRGRKAEARVKETFEEDEAEETEEAEEEIEDLVSDDEDEIGLAIPKIDLEPEEVVVAAADDEEEEEDEEEEAPRPKGGGKPVAVPAPAKKAAAKEVAVPPKPVPPAKAEPAPKPAAKAPAKAVPVPAKVAPAPA